jgi:hypothetical protein
MQCGEAKCLPAFFVSGQWMGREKRKREEPLGLELRFGAGQQPADIGVVFDDYQGRDQGGGSVRLSDLFL